MIQYLLLLLASLPLCLVAQIPHPSTAVSPSSEKVELQAIPEDFTNLYNQQLLQKRRKWQKKAQEAEDLWQQHNTGRTATPGVVHTLPVVVHVIHNNGLSNIDKAQVRKGIEQLNAAFANTGFYNPSSGVDAGIQFCLARSNPAGLWTDGINYVNSNLAIMNPNTDDGALKNLIQWDANQYINIWVVEKFIGTDIEGYATIPAVHGSNRDGIVIEWQNIGLHPDFTKYLVHEMGHYLGLLNLYDGGGCVNNDCTTDGDRVCDTPPQDDAFSTSNCNILFNTCFADEDDTSPNNPFRPVALGGLGEQFDLPDNYMRPFWIECIHAFTQGQADRMDFFLHNDRASLLNSTTCQPACTGILATAAFTSSSPTATTGVPINFINTSNNALSYEWFVEGVSVGTTTNMSYTFATTGTYEVTLEARNNLPQCAERTSMLVEVYCAAGCAEICDNGIDDNGDGLIDCLDPTCICNTCSGKQANHWHFGYYAAINFDSGSPQPSYGSSLINLEACASISDPNGNLLFYTDGRTVWNRNHQVMGNGTGLRGDYSTSNIVIIPKPNDPAIYYIFVPDQQAFARGLTYTEVDLSQNRSLGAVTRKNIPLTPNIKTTEHITAVKHCDNLNYWVMVKEWDSNTYYSFLVSTTGVGTTPVTQSIGQAHSLMGIGLTNAIGTMRINPQGNKMAIVYYERQGIEVLDFDRSTAQLSNPVFYELDEQPYGLEFSPDGAYLYATQEESFTNNKLYQYDLSYSTPTQVVDSAYLVTQANRPFNIRLGPDYKIYTTSLNDSFLNVINQPNLKGMACAYQEKAVDLAFGGNFYGLPYMLSSQLFAEPTSWLSGKTELCTSTTPEPYVIEQEECSGIQAVTWQHHGVNTVSNATDSTILLLPTNAGQDTLIATVITACATAKDTIIITTNTNLSLDLGRDTSFCAGETFVIQANEPFDSYRWSDGSQDSVLEVQATGQYWLVATDACGGTTRDTIEVVFLALPTLMATINGTGTARDTIILGDVFGVEAGVDERSQGVQYLWIDDVQGIGLNWDSITIPTTTGKPTLEGQYELYIRASYPDLGCDQLDTLWLVVEPPLFLGVPNAFTPNGDGQNDTFAPLGLSVDDVQEFKIYNRWGQVVFEASEGNIAWDGSYQGQAQPVDLYLYYLSYQLPGGEVQTLRGEVTLIR